MGFLVVLERSEGPGGLEEARRDSGWRSSASANHPARHDAVETSPVRDHEPARVHRRRGVSAVKGHRRPDLSDKGPDSIPNR